MPKTNQMPKGTEGYSEFHEKIEEIIKENWGIQPKFSDPFSWGYSSTGIYIKDTQEREYVAMLAQNSKEKKQAMEKNIAIANSIKLSVRTPKQLKTKAGKFLIELDKIEVPSGKSVENKLMSLGYFLSGILPFDMNLDIVGQATKVLEEIHQIPAGQINFPLEKIECDTPKFLHGDLTPSNMLISYGKVVAVLDFELSLIGPVEYDLARLGVFSWFRMTGVSYGKVLSQITDAYSNNNLSDEMLKEFSYLHCKMHLDNVERHKDIYETSEKYQEERLFAEKMVKNLTADLAQI
ncbi:aminoglycoside phosphotransferase family protein [Patescibacteria group bacterium]|nr:aminoglycoside phosphotransferase family protein [Patescibacteria group bacterium]